MCDACAAGKFQDQSNVPSAACKFALKVTNMSAQPQVVRSVQQVSTKIKIQLLVLTVKIVPQLSIKTKLDSAAANKIYANSHLVELQHLVPDAPHITMIYAQGVL